MNWNTAANLPPGVFIFPTTSPSRLTAPPILADLRAPSLPTTPCQAGATDPNFSQGKSAQWNLDVQRAITNHLTLDVAYVGVHGYNEEVLKDLNQPPHWRWVALERRKRCHLHHPTDVYVQAQCRSRSRAVQHDIPVP